jgi:flagellar biosynthesis/type III secretory pathway protein FliH
VAEVSAADEIAERDREVAVLRAENDELNRLLRLAAKAEKHLDAALAFERESYEIVEKECSRLAIDNQQLLATIARFDNGIDEAFNEGYAQGSAEVARLTAERDDARRLLADRMIEVHRLTADTANQAADALAEKVRYYDRKSLSSYEEGKLDAFARSETIVRGFGGAP